MATNPFTGQPKNSAARLRVAHYNSVGQELAPHSTGKPRTMCPVVNLLCVSAKPEKHYYQLPGSVRSTYPEMPYILGRSTIATLI
jgi:hypothetical protein